MSNGTVKDRVKFFENFAKANKDASKKPKKSPKKTEQPCPLAEVKLVELVEIVKRGSAEAPVSGVAKDAKKKTPLQGSNRKVMRPPANPARQYINLKKDLQGADKSRPEHDRYIELRARVEWKDSSKKDSLSGHKVHFKATETKHTTRPQLFKVDKEKPGFGGNNDKMTTEATSNADGWTDPVKFYLSQFGGDKYKISAKADEDGKGKMGPEIKTGDYEVWRRFWYQNTVAKDFDPPDLGESIETYKNVNAEMVASKTAKVEFTSVLLEAKEVGIAEHTIYKKSMCEKNNNENKDVAIVGSHNEKAVRKFLKTKTEIPEEPVKAHLMFCEYQWDPQGYTAAFIKVFPKNVKEKTFEAPDGEIIIKPALKGDLVLAGSVWVPIKTDGTLDEANKKALTKDHIKIPKPRSSLRKFTVSLPNEAVNAGKAVGKNGIAIYLTLAKAAEYLGDSDGHQITVAYVGTETGANNTASHEIGHAFYQVPQSEIKNADSWKNGTDYKKDSDFVEYKGGLYRCLKDGKGHCPSEGGTEWVGVTYKAAWDTNKTYSKNEVVKKATKYWISLKDTNKGNTPSAGTWWAQSPLKNNWDKNTTYSKNDYVAHNGGKWASLTNNNKGKQPPGGQWWTACPDKGIWRNGSTYDQNDVVSHENNDYVSLKGGNSGHKPPNDEWWKKVYYREKPMPFKGKFKSMHQFTPPPSPTLGLHPKQYTNERGGSGSHCATGASDETNATWNKVVAGAHLWYEGDCVMYHAGDNKAANSIEYCAECKKYLRLQDMSKMQNPSRT